MSKNKTVLIAGGGVAGPVLAYWLSDYGFKVKVLERAPRLRLGGQNIDVGNSGVDIMKMMGAEKLIKSHNTTEQGLMIVDREGHVQAKFPKGTETSFTAPYEILRGDLTQILYDLSKDKAEYVFDDEVRSVEQEASKVHVRYRSGRSEDFDFVIAADGLGSKTRAAIFGSESFFRYQKVCGAYMTIPRLPRDNTWARWYNAGGGRVLMLRPDNHGTIRASIFFWQEQLPQDHLGRDETLTKLREVLAGAGWEADRIARDMEFDRDIYFGPVSQIHMPSWSKGRCAVVGDAAYCPTPFTGMGSTLAVIGAYVLAGELAHRSDYREAFRRYESQLRPFVEKAQRLPPGVPRLAYPRSKLAVALLNDAFKFAALPITQHAIGFFRDHVGSREEKFTLPNYGKVPENKSAPLDATAGNKLELR